MTGAVLITGFGPFPGVPKNASAAMAQDLARIAPTRIPKAAGNTFHAATLRTEWGAGPDQLFELLDRHQPALALHFGVSERAAGFVIETRGENACQPAEDAAGNAPPSDVLSATGPQFRAVTLPVAGIVHRLRSAGFPAETSDDAGRYLCNAILYHSLAWAERRATTGQAVSRPLVGFIHLPHDPAAATAPLSPIDGALLAFETCLAVIE